VFEQGSIMSPFDAPSSKLPGQ